MHRLRKIFLSFLTGAQDSHLQTVTILEAAYIQLRRRPPEDARSTNHLVFAMYMSYGWGYTGENVTSERKIT